MNRFIASAMFALALGIVPFVAQSGDDARTGRSVQRAAATAAPVGWPNIGGDPHHAGYRSDAALGTANAASLGINWMTRIYYADIGSPVVAYNAALKADVIYVGDENGDEFAIDEATGRQLWSVNFGTGDALRATPLYVKSDNSLWVATIYDQTMRKLDASTGKQLCSYRSIYNVLSSPISVVLPNGKPIVYYGVQDGAKSGPETALNEGNCSLYFSYDKLRAPPAGSWDSPAYELSSSGEPILVFATADTDSTVYAIDASTAAELWDYNVFNPPNQHGGYDVAAAPTMTAPGVNGFADGVVYIATKYGYVYALDLTSGKVMWQYDEFGGQNVTRDDIGAMTIDGKTMVGGFLNGVYSINAVTGAQIWQVLTTAEVESTPNIIGPSGRQITSFADLSGKFYVLNMATGKQLYSYQTGGYVTGSPAETNGHLIDVSSDGFLYDFAPGGSNVAPPTTTVSYPANASALSNPNGNLTVRGSAVDATAVGAVHIAIQTGGRGGLWWNAATSQWQSGPVGNPATLASPGAASTTWSFSFPIGAAGGPYTLLAYATNSGRQADRTGDTANFTIAPSASAPNIAATLAYVPPSGATTASGAGFGPSEHVAFTLNGATVGNATTDATGAIAPVKLSVPTGTALGPTTLMATGQTSNFTALTPFTVGNSWMQAGGNTGHTSFENNDVILDHVLHVGPGIFISPAYYYNATSPSNSSPIVSNGIAYFGNDTGVMTAVTVTVGAPTWTYQTNSSSAIDTTPAVDKGVLYFGSSDGNAYALNAASGSLVTTYPIGGNVSSPAAGDGYVVFTSDNGSVVVISDSTGKIVESLNLGVAIHSSPTIDTAIGAVVVGDDSGAVSALGLTNGKTIWTRKTGAAVDAPAALAGTSLYVGSTDGSLYALNATTGALSWTYATGSPIRTGALLNFQGGGPTVAAGNDAGTFYALTGSGTLLWQQALGAAVAGIGAADNTIMVTTTDGTLWGLRPEENGLILMHFHTGMPLSTVPAVNNGAVYVASEAGGLYAFTPYGTLPFSKGHGAAVHVNDNRPYPIHFDWPRRQGYSRLAPVARDTMQRTTRTYAIFWAPRVTMTDPRYAAAVETYLTSPANASVRNGSLFGGSSVDRSPYPPVVDATAVEQSIARAIERNGWSSGIDVRFVVFTGHGANVAPIGSCGYHSAFDVARDRSLPAVYALVPDERENGCDAATKLARTGDVELESALSNVARQHVEMEADPLVTGR